MAHKLDTVNITSFTQNENGSVCSVCSKQSCPSAEARRSSEGQSLSVLCLCARGRGKKERKKDCECRSYLHCLLCQWLHVPIRLC
jgi:hypothetical protein